MSYELTLTAAERRAIDWVGYRYWNGDDLHGYLTRPSKLLPEPSGEWDSREPITFYIPEHVAWQIAHNYEAEGCPCFGPELTSKIAKLVESVV